jgi:hypothetical protein
MYRVICELSFQSAVEQGNIVSHSLVYRGGHPYYNWNITSGESDSQGGVSKPGQESHQAYTKFEIETKFHRRSEL